MVKEALSSPSPASPSEMNLKRKYLQDKYTFRKIGATSRDPMAAKRDLTRLEVGKKLGNFYSRNNSVSCRSSKSSISTTTTTTSRESYFDFIKKVGNGYSRRNREVQNKRTSSEGTQREVASEIMKPLKEEDLEITNPEERFRAYKRNDIGNYYSLKNRLKTIEKFPESIDQHPKIRQEHTYCVIKCQDIEDKYSMNIAELPAEEQREEVKRIRDPAEIEKKLHSVFYEPPNQLDLPPPPPELLHPHEDDDEEFFDCTDNCASELVLPSFEQKLKYFEKK